MQPENRHAGGEEHQQHDQAVPESESGPQRQVTRSLSLMNRLLKKPATLKFRIENCESGMAALAKGLPFEIQNTSFNFSFGLRLQ
jgi:hypothetical protein